MDTQPARHSVSVSGVIPDDHGRVLLIRRRDNQHWEPPGRRPGAKRDHPGWPAPRDPRGNRARHRARRPHRRLQEHAPRHHRPGLPLQDHRRPPHHQRRGNRLPLGRPSRHPPVRQRSLRRPPPRRPPRRHARPPSASTTEPSCSAKASTRCICAALPNLAVFDQGGACGAAGPASAPGSALGRPARRTPGPRATDRSGSFAVRTGAAGSRLPRAPGVPLAAVRV